MYCQLCSSEFTTAERNTITVRKKSIDVCPKCHKKESKKTQKERDELYYIFQWGSHKDGLNIIVDSREQKEWKFSKDHTLWRAPLHTGDYTLLNWEDLVTIDRKELSDIVGCMLKANRQRFIKELKRMSRYPFAAVVIEADLSEIYKGNYRSKISPESVIGSLTKWAIKYGVHVYYASNRTYASKLCVKILSHFAKNYIEQHERMIGVVPYFKKLNKTEHINDGE